MESETRHEAVSSAVIPVRTVVRLEAHVDRLRLLAEEYAVMRGDEESVDEPADAEAA